MGNTKESRRSTVALKLRLHPNTAARLHGNAARRGVTAAAYVTALVEGDAS